MTLPPSSQDADRRRWKKLSTVSLKTKKFQDFYLVLSTFQVLTRVVDCRVGSLFFWGDQSSFSLECTSNSWKNCWGGSNCSVSAASPPGPAPPVAVSGKEPQILITPHKRRLTTFLPYMVHGSSWGRPAGPGGSCPRLWLRAGRKAHTHRSSGTAPVPWWGSGGPEQRPSRASSNTGVSLTH